MSASHTTPPYDDNVSLVVTCYHGERRENCVYVMMLLILVAIHAEIFQKYNVNTFTYAYFPQVGHLEEEK